MKKHTLTRTAIAVVLMLCVCLLCACAKPIEYGIMNDSIALSPERFGTYVNQNDPEDTYRSVTIKDRVYLPFGVQGKTLSGEMIGECIAFDRSDNNIRYYRVIGSDDFIAEYLVNSVMEPFYILRAEDTIGKSIEIPDFISSQDYDIWK